jgi:peroxiredoxin
VAFTARDAVILAIGPNDSAAFRRYWASEHMPFAGLADPGHVVADQYKQEVNLLRLGRMPALLVVDRAGRIRYAHYGHSMSDIPDNREILDLLDSLNSGTG